MECSICLEKIESNQKSIKLKCGHIFHTSCLTKINNHLCPLCRQKINLNNNITICYGYHKQGYSPYTKCGPCRICYGYQLKHIFNFI